MDNQLKEALQQIVNLPTEERIALSFTAMKGLVPEINKLFDKDRIPVIILSIFSTSVAADGKLSKEEYALVKAFLQAFEINMDDETLMKMIKDLSSKEAYMAVLSLSKILSVEGQANLVSLVAAICAIDDRIETSEVAYLSDLYNA